MSTPAQTRANQENAKLSTGPVGAEGKAKMHVNPLRHGLTSKHLIIPGENQADFDALLYSLRLLYQPVTPREEELLTEVAEHNWRLLRARRVETATISLYVERLLKESEAAGDINRALALAFEKHGREIERLRRYETTIKRAYLQAKKELELLVEARIQYQKRQAAEQQPEIGSVSQDAPKTTAQPTASCLLTPVSCLPPIMKEYAESLHSRFERPVSV